MVTTPLLDMVENPKKILLVDKEPGVTRLIKRALEKTGKYWVKEEHDSKFALNSAKAFQPDLILLDTVNDGSDREQLAKTIQTDTTLHDTPMLSLSSLKPESQMISGGILSGYSFFAAPVRVEEVLKGVEEVLFGKD
ncbi:MAG TPA: hypothetical protein VJ719_16585 [Chthoniobacterales bacterium]|nr:hypothetical protein [Chthoniobacterales bacterium]